MMILMRLCGVLESDAPQSAPPTRLRALWGGVNASGSCSKSAKWSGNSIPLLPAYLRLLCVFFGFSLLSVCSREVSHAAVVKSIRLFFSKKSQKILIVVI